MAKLATFRLTTRLAHRYGFAIIIALLVVSTVMAWNIQEDFSERSFGVHRHYVEQQEILTSLRRILWAAGISLRDFYIDPTPDREELDTDIRKLKAESRHLVSELRGIGSPDAEIAELKTQLRELWRQTELAARENWDPSRRFEFLQKEVVPSRDEA